ncbi:MAG: segregation and condensation protein A [Brevinematia bacterium]
MIGFIRNGYNIHIRNFDGPLDLLLELIQNSKMNITEIAISEITDQYLFYLRTMQFFNIDIASEFFLVAASLIYIKTKKLLPSQATEENEELIDEEELIRRLKNYKVYKGIARILWKKKEEGDVYFSRPFAVLPADNKKLESQEFYLGDLINALKRYRGAFIKKPIPIKRREVTVEEKMKLIISILEKKKFVLWSELDKIEKTKVDKVATFLGGLELSFRQKVLLYQIKQFADFEIRGREIV